MIKEGVMKVTYRGKDYSDYVAFDFTSMASKCSKKSMITIVTCTNYKCKYCNMHRCPIGDGCPYATAHKIKEPQMNSKYHDEFIFLEKQKNIAKCKMPQKYSQFILDNYLSNVTPALYAELKKHGDFDIADLRDDKYTFKERMKLIEKTKSEEYTYIFANSMIPFFTNILKAYEAELKEYYKLITMETFMSESEILYNKLKDTYKDDDIFIDIGKYIICTIPSWRLPVRYMMLHDREIFLTFNNGDYTFVEKEKLNDAISAIQNWAGQLDNNEIAWRRLLIEELEAMK